MNEPANEVKVSVEANTAVVPDFPRKPAQQWLDQMSPMVNRLTGAILDTRAAVEKRLGFCPMAEAAKLASRGLDALAEQLRRAAGGLRAFAAFGRPEAAEPQTARPPRAQA
jgi:hypothetical protein